jgi:mono/diheme cytochrome c family protein
MLVSPLGVAFAKKAGSAPSAAVAVPPSPAGLVAPAGLAALAGLAAPADPALGKHLFRHYCAACHGLSGAGDGVNADNLDPHPADLTGEEVSTLTDAEIYEVIEKGGAAVELSAAMPPWGKTLSADSIRNLVAYIRTISGDAPEEQKKGAAVRFDDIRTGGKADCAICHMQPGQQKQRAPNLGYEGSKLNGGWLASFLKHPERIRPIGFLPLTKTKMPNFYFSDEEVAALTSYLMTQKDARITGGEMAGFDLASEGEVEKGRALFEDQFACSACHRSGGEGGGQVGPDLATTAKRLKPEWVFAWLKDPQSIRTDAPMPNFGMTDAEARSLVAYLFSIGERGMKEALPGDAAQIAKGEKLVKDKNCLSCHILNRYNSQAKLGESH